MDNWCFHCNLSEVFRKTCYFKTETEFLFPSLLFPRIQQCKDAALNRSGGKETTQPWLFLPIRILPPRIGSFAISFRVWISQKEAAFSLREEKRFSQRWFVYPFRGKGDGCEKVPPPAVWLMRLLPATPSPAEDSAVLLTAIFLWDWLVRAIILLKAPHGTRLPDSSCQLSPDGLPEGTRCYPACTRKLSTTRRHRHVCI